MRTLFFLFCLLNASSVFAAQPPKKEPENTPSNKALKPQSDSKNAIDWGDWDKKFQSLAMNIKVVQDNNSGKVGIFDAKRGSWSKLNNITYGPDYFEITAEQGYGVFDFNKDSEDDSSKISSGDLPPQYLLGVYSKSQSVDDNTNFYVLDPGDGSAGVLIFSHNTWKTQAEPAWIDLDSDEIDFDKDYDKLDDKSTGPIS